MLKCPVCRGRLPFSEILGLHGPVVCPHCSNELKLKVWNRLVIFMVAYTAANSLTALLRGRGLGFVPAILVSCSGFIVVFLLLQILIGRYQLKPPPVSITRTD